MAEVVAGLWAAEEVVSTSVQAGAAGYAVAKPTMPLKATFSQLASTTDHQSNSSLVRSHHTVTVLGKKAYIFGGQTNRKELASNDIHSIALPVKGAPVPEYQVLPAIPSEEGRPVPAPRAGHAACALGSRIAIYGGRDEAGKPVDGCSRLWLYDTEKSAWDTLEPSSHPERVPPPRSKGKLFAHDGNLILYGGLDSSGSPLTDVWRFDCFTKVWNQFPHAPVATSSAALAGDILYLITASGALSNDIHSLTVKVDAEPPTWETISFPINPLVPGPKSRENGGLLPVTTGYGRNYLLYFFGEQQGTVEGSDLLQWSDLWTFQLPSSDLEVHASTQVTEAIKPAKIKDQIRSKLGADTGQSTWAEVEVQAPGDLQAHEGKSHPGPRSSFGYDVTADGTKVVLWGGIDAKGDPQGDGWIIKLT
ncbi:hypothetical protein F4775DRAFT_589904 [Biscogniauxia sp. FL1348]|nr:hypothetical protein F4775DRAFT_589904 [Biscogniauxia sp. FL1348]